MESDMEKIVQLVTSMLEKLRHLYACTVKCWKHGEYVKKNIFKGLAYRSMTALLFTRAHSPSKDDTQANICVHLCKQKKKKTQQSEGKKKTILRPSLPVFLFLCLSYDTFSQSIFKCFLLYSPALEQIFSRSLCLWCNFAHQQLFKNLHI